MLPALARLLPLPGVVSGAARSLASQGDRSEQAVQIYFKHVQAQRGKKTKDASADPVHRFLQDDLCRVTPEMTAGESARALELNRKVLKSNKDLEWAHYYLGLALGIRGQYEEAVSHLDSAARLRPARVEPAYFSKIYGGMALEKKGELEKAMRMYRAARSLQTGGPEALIGLARVLVAKCRMIEEEDSPDAAEQIGPLAKAAVENSSRAVSLRPKAADYHYFHGRALSFAGESGKAAEAYAKAIRIEPKVKEYHFHLAIELARSGDSGGALKAVERAVKLDGRYADGYQVWGDLLASGGEHDKAVDRYKKALSVDGKHVRARLGLGRVLFDRGRLEEAARELEPICSRTQPAAYLVARIYSLTGRFEEAVPLYEGLTSGGREGADALYYLGCAQANLRRFEPAIEALTKCVQVDAKRWQGYLQRGHCYMSIRELENARLDYMRAEQLQPEEPEVALALARYHFVQGDNETAAVYLEKCSEPKSMDWSIRMMLGVLREGSGDLEKAEECFRSAAEARPDRREPLACIGILHCHKGEHEEARKYLQQVEDMGHVTDPVLYHLGFSKAECGDYEGAMAAWRELMARNPEDEHLMLNTLRLSYLLGRAHVESERYADAVEAWKEYLRSRPDDDQLKRDLAEVHFRCGVTYLAGDGKDRAREEFDAALALNSDHPCALLYRAILDIFAGNAEEGLSALGALANGSASEMRLRALYHQGIAHLRGGRNDLAAEVLLAVSKDPDRGKLDSPVELLLSAAHARAGRWQEALEVLSSSIEGAPVSP